MTLDRPFSEFSLPRNERLSILTRFPLMAMTCAYCLIRKMPLEPHRTTGFGVDGLQCATRRCKNNEDIVNSHYESFCPLSIRFYFMVAARTVENIHCRSECERWLMARGGRGEFRIASLVFSMSCTTVLHGLVLLAVRHAKRARVERV